MEDTIIKPHTESSDTITSTKDPRKVAAGKAAAGKAKKRKKRKQVKQVKKKNQQQVINKL